MRPFYTEPTSLQTLVPETDSLPAEQSPVALPFESSYAAFQSSIGNSAMAQAVTESPVAVSPAISPSALESQTMYGNAAVSQAYSTAPATVVQTPQNLKETEAKAVEAKELKAKAPEALEAKEAEAKAPEAAAVLPGPAPEAQPGAAPAPTPLPAPGEDEAAAPVAVEVQPAEPKKEKAGKPAAAAAPKVEAKEEQPAEAKAGGKEAAGKVELLMPEPPSDLSPAAKGRIKRVQGKSAKAATVVSTLPSGKEHVAEARGAVAEPDAETAGRAEGKLVEMLGGRPAPSPEIEQLCKRIYDVIRSKRPPDEDKLVEAKPDEMAKEAGGELDKSIQGDTKRVEGSYDELDKSPKGTPELKPKDIDAPPKEVDTPEINATQAVPDAVPAENVSLDADVAASQSRMDDAGMNKETAKLVQSGPIAEAREAQGELEETAKQDPAVVLAKQGELLAAANNDMAALQQSALVALTNSRGSTVTKTGSQQQKMVGTEEEMRAQIGQRAKTIFSDAQKQVNALLAPLSKNAMSQWEEGKKFLSLEFKQELADVKQKIKKRHSGVGGFFRRGWDYATGLPDWVTERYDKAEQKFGDGVCKLVRKISTEVKGIVLTCEALIDKARQDIKDLFTKDLPDNLGTWAATELARFNDQLDGLHKKVEQTHDKFNKDLVRSAGESVQAVREEIHALREAAKGLIGRIADAIGRFLDDPIKFIINGLLDLVGIPPASFWALVDRIKEVISDIADDPLTFANNLMDALAKGFSQFFDHIGTHLLNGLLEWLFSGLGSAGVEIPADFSLKSIITFFLQLMGITWPRVRKLLVKHVGEENVALVEKAYGLLSELIAKGPEGIFEMIKEKLDPQTILDQVLKAAVDYLMEALIKQVTVRVIALFNPAGAIIQALEAIYRVLKWIFENAARIFKLIETIVNGVYDILKGNISGMANAVEKALAGLVAPVISFLADYFGFGDLPERVSETIKGFQDWIESLLDKAIGWLVEKGKQLLQAVGLGKEEEKPDKSKFDGQIGKVVSWTAAGESHQLWIVSEGGGAVVMMASAGGEQILNALTVYETKANGLKEEDAETSAEVLGDVQKARQLVSKMTPEANKLSKEVTDEKADQATIEAEDAALEGEEEELKTLMIEIQTKLGLNDDEQIKKARAEFGTRLFSSKDELAPLLKVSDRTARRRVAKWTADGILFNLSSAETDPLGTYSFDPTKADQRETHPNNRSKYGYSNPKKTSTEGLKILSKGLHRGKKYPQPVLEDSVDYHVNKAHYFSTRPGSTYTDFQFPVAILGHKEEMGASDHWKLYGHKQSKSDNQAWNKNPDNYQGPEHETESAASGGSSERYIVPMKSIGSHKDWW